MAVLATRIWPSWRRTSLQPKGSRLDSPRTRPKLGTDFRRRGFAGNRAPISGPASWRSEPNFRRNCGPGWRWHHAVCERKGCQHHAASTMWSVLWKSLVSLGSPLGTCKFDVLPPKNLSLLGRYSTKSSRTCNGPPAANTHLGKDPMSNHHARKKTSKPSKYTYIYPELQWTQIFVLTDKFRTLIPFMFWPSTSLATHPFADFGVPSISVHFPLIHNPWSSATLLPGRRLTGASLFK